MRTVTAIALVLLLGALGCQSQEERAVEHRERAETYIENEQWGEAKIELLNLIQAAPEDAQARFKLGETLFRLGEYADALWQYQEAVRLDPDQLAWRTRLAGLEFAGRRLDKVREQVAYVLERDPENIDALLLRSRLSGQERNAGGAIEDLERVLELEPDHATALLLYSQILTLVQRVDEAEAALKRLIAAREVTGSYALLALFYTQQQRTAEAEAAYRKAIELSEDAKQRKSARLALANLLIGAGEPLRAESELMAARDDAPEDSELLVAIARYYVYVGKRDKAIGMLEERAARDPENPEPLVTLARFYRGHRKNEKALEVLDRALALDPSYENARVMRADMLIQRGAEQPDSPGAQKGREEGRATIEAVLAENPASIRGLFTKAKLALADGNYEEASVLLRRVLEEQPDASAHFLLGSAYLSMRQDDLARSEFLAALQLDATSHPARTQLAALYLRTGNPEMAATEARRGLGVRPGDVKLSLILAEALIATREPDEARDTLNALELESADIDPSLRLRAVTSYLELGEVERAREVVAALLEQQPAHPAALSRAVLVEARAGQPSAALGALNKAVAQEPDNPELYRIRGGFFLGFRHPSSGAPMFPGEAQADLLTAIELEPDNATSYLLLGKLRERMGNPKEAVQHYDKAIELDPGTGEAYLLAGVLYERAGDNQAAIERYQGLVEAAGQGKVAGGRDLGVAMNNMAWLLADEDATPEELDRALELAQDAKELMPEDPNVADTLGWVMYRRDIHAAAISLFREAITGYQPGTSSRALTRYHLALSYEANGEPDRAIQELKLSLQEAEAFPDREQAEDALKRLEAS